MKTPTHVFRFALLAVLASGCAVAADGVIPAALESADVPSTDLILVTDSGQNTMADVPAPPRYTYVAVVADTHFEAPGDPHAQNAIALGQTLQGLPYELAGIFVAGDICFTHEHATYDEYMADTDDRYDVAEQAFDGWPAPVWPALGNHDYDFEGQYPMALARQLFKHHFGTDPYYAVDLGAWKFIVLDNFSGATFAQGTDAWDYNSGSLGAEQLAWLEDQLSDGRPAVLMLHFPLFVVQDLPAVLARHADTVRLVLSGHSHAWLNLADNFSVPHMVVGTSQYDADSFLVLRLDNELQTWRILNWDDFHWGSAYSLPWSED
jgi:hypothetical protein